MSNRNRWQMSIDPSLTGFCMGFWHPSHPTEVELRELSSKAWAKNPSVADRLARYHTLIDEAKHEAQQRNAETILIEGYSYNSRGSVIYLGEFGGLLRDRLNDCADKLLEVSPAVLKKFATGNGNAKKPLVVSALASRYKREFKTDNEADAFGLIQIAIVLSGHRQPTNEIERQIANGILARGESTKTRKSKAKAKNKKRDEELFGEQLDEDEE